MNKKLIYFLMNQVILTMDYKKYLLVLFIFFYTSTTFSEIIYNKNNLIITNIDLNNYKQIYKNNYDLDIDNNSALKDLVLINNLIKYFENFNKEFLNQIDSQILEQYGGETFNDISFRDFLRFSKIRDEFIINYFNNNLRTDEIINLFGKLESLKLPISTNECMIIEKTIDLKNNKEFIKILLQNLKTNTRDFKIILNDSMYDICVDENNFKFMQRLIIEYIETQTEEEFKIFVYDKTEN